jgi:hypothetical protein
MEQQQLPYSLALILRGHGKPTKPHSGNTLRKLFLSGSGKSAFCISQPFSA